MVPVLRDDVQIALDRVDILLKVLNVCSNQHLSYGVLCPSTVFYT